MRTTKTLTYLSLLGIALSVMACVDAKDIRDTRGGVYLRTNFLQTFVESDVITNVGGVETDSIQVEFTNQPKVDSEEFPAEVPAALQTIVVTSCRISYVRRDGGFATYPVAEIPLNVEIEVNASTSIQVPVMPANYKLLPPGWNLVTPGFEPETNLRVLTFDTYMEFFGKTKSGEKVTSKGAIVIYLADYINE